MYRSLILTILCLHASVLPAQADQTPVPGFSPYLGMAVPYPADTLTRTIATGGNNPELPYRSVVVTLLIDSAGNVLDLKYPPDSADFARPVETILKSARYQFTGGNQLPSPVMLPVGVSYRALTKDTLEVVFRFPLGADQVPDTTLLYRLFSLNGVTPPEVIALPPLFYRVDSTRDTLEYLVITAQVTLDERGELTDLAFPVPGHDRMTHTVHAALIRARFKPATLGGQLIPCQFLLTFRLFDNLRYPYSPFDPPDSGASLPMTTRYFMTRYFSDADFSIIPLPRNYPSRYLLTPRYGTNRIGNAKISITISTAGIVVSQSLRTVTPEVTAEARTLVRLIQWYPALNRAGQAVEYTGMVSLTFDGSAEVVYIPEWLTW
jgi:hypothetical protein